jgi:hypothetical protein
MTPEEKAAADAAQAAADAAAASTTNIETAPTENSDVTTETTVETPDLTPEELAAKLKRLDDLEAAETTRAQQAETDRLAQLSETERERERAEAAEAAATANQTALDAEIKAGNEARLRIAVEKAATDLGVKLHPTAIDDAIALGDFSAVTFNEQREPQGVTEAVKTLVEKKPHYVEKATAPNLGGNDAGRNTGIDATTPAVRRAQREMRRGF